jgi:hypothetical protein
MTNVIVYCACAVLLAFSGWQLWAGFTRGVVGGYWPVRRDRAPVSFWLTMFVYAAAFALIVFVLGYPIVQVLLGHEAA